MPWPGTIPWSEKTAAELRPVIVALCNAVGDRYQCIGMNRPAWPVNTAHSISTLTVGTKSATLVDADLYGLDIFRYGWWGLIASGITTLVNYGTASNTALGGTHCRGWCKTDSGTGLTTNVWTMAGLEADVGLGTISASAIGGLMHLFDEVAPNRLRGILDRMIYPVIFPLDILGYGGFGGGWRNLSSAAEAEITANEFYVETAHDGLSDGDDAWTALAAGTPLGDTMSCQVGFDDYVSFVRASYRQKNYAVLDFSGTQNGAGYLGSVSRQLWAIAHAGIDFDGGDLYIQGATAVLPGGSGYAGGTIEVVGTDPVLVTGTQEVPYTWGNFTRTPSPCSQVHTGARLGFGTASGTPAFLYSGPGIWTHKLGTNNRAIATRFILDISANCSDQ